MYVVYIRFRAGVIWKYVARQMMKYDDVSWGIKSGRVFIKLHPARDWQNCNAKTGGGSVSASGSLLWFVMVSKNAPIPSVYGVQYGGQRFYEILNAYVSNIIWTKNKSKKYTKPGPVTKKMKPKLFLESVCYYSDYCYIDKRLWMIFPFDILYTVICCVQREFFFFLKKSKIQRSFVIGFFYVVLLTQLQNI